MLIIIIKKTANSILFRTISLIFGFSSLYELQFAIYLLPNKLKVLKTIKKS
jgi:hypothetical protein